MSESGVHLIGRSALIESYGHEWLSEERLDKLIRVPDPQDEIGLKSSVD